MILSNSELRKLVEGKYLIINPLKPDTIRENGVDLHLGNKIARFKQTFKTMDTKENFNPEEFFEVEVGDKFLLKPNEKILVYTLEYLELPNDLMGFIELRSTYARCGLTLPPTVVDGGFKGNLTLAISGSTFPVKLYAGERFIHVVFAKLSSPIQKPYSGKYQKQKGLTFPKFD